MKARIAKWGNSLAVRLPRIVAEDLGLVPGGEVELRQEGTRLTLETATKQCIPRYRLQDLMARIKPHQKPPRINDWSAIEPPWPNDDWSDIAPKDEEWSAMKRNARTKRAPGKRRA